MADRPCLGVQASEVFSLQGSGGQKDTVSQVSHWKVSGGAQKVYDKALKGFVYRLMISDGAPAMLQLPKDDRGRHGLGIVQPVLVFQLLLPQGRERPFSLELGVLDASQKRRRLLLSTTLQGGAQTCSQHARLPLQHLRRGNWLNLCLDVDSLVQRSFGQTFRSVESVVVHSECRLRRIFSMRCSPLAALDGSASDRDSALCTGAGGDREGGAAGATQMAETIPRSQDFPLGVEQHTQVIDAAEIFGHIANDDSSMRPRSKQHCLQRDASRSRGHELLGQHTLVAHDASPALVGEENLVSVSSGGITTHIATSGDEESVVAKEPIGYEDMVRRGGRPEELNCEMAQVSQEGLAAYSRSILPDPKRTHPAVGSRCKVVPGACPSNVVGGASTAVAGPPTRRPKTRQRVDYGACKDVCSGGGREARSCASVAASVNGAGTGRTHLGESAGRRLPLSARAGTAGERSPSGVRVGRARPLPLEMNNGGTTAAASRRSAPEMESHTAGVAPSSSRRGRRPARLSVTNCERKHNLASTQVSAIANTTDETFDKESFSPSPSGATRRRNLAMGKFHRTAEIYGCVHPQKAMRRGERHEAAPGGGDVEGRCLDQAGEEEETCITATCAQRLMSPLSNAQAGPSSRSQSPAPRTPEMHQESFLQSPSQLLAAQMKAPVELAFDIPSPGLSSSPDRAPQQLPDGDSHNNVGDEARITFGATMRHHDGPHAFWGRSGVGCNTASTHLAESPALGFSLAFAPRVGSDSGAEVHQKNCPNASDGGSCTGCDSIMPAVDCEHALGWDTVPIALVEEQRRIKSLSPPRRTRRPQPFLTLDKAEVRPDAAGGLPAPNSAPSEVTKTHFLPFAHTNAPTLAPSRAGNRLAVAQTCVGSTEVVQKRPFTPPVVAVGKLLKNLSEQHRNTLTALHVGTSVANLIDSTCYGAIGMLPAMTAKAEGVSILGREIRAEPEAAIGPMLADESMLEAIYDASLDMYYEPATGKYYERSVV
eukprot:TRINITY_DN15957_c0_g2_i1.p1 TRINITY_DN15957_c0_g2~~TRINITY_DN15957_c0_g2_i1.p1  ORF type:complete len:996 (-),score=123.57 TRINITY_DN15957_c0_g2_i1:224-3211(-)